jgi:post-segregation antitoxin (ccd killing protein)
LGVRIIGVRIIGVRIIGVRENGGIRNEREKMANRKWRIENGE